MNDPKNEKSWRGIATLTDSEKNLVKKILEVLVDNTETTEPEENTTGVVVINASAEIKYSSPEIRNYAISAFKALGYDEADLRSYGVNPVLKVFDTFVFEDEDFSGDGDTLISDLKEEVEDCLLETIERVSDFIGAFEEKAEIHIDNVSIEKCEEEEKSSESEDPMSALVQAFNTGRVNPQVTGSYSESINLNYAFKLGQLVTRAKTFETSELGSSIEKIVGDILTSFLSLL